MARISTSAKLHTQQGDNRMRGWGAMTRGESKGTASGYGMENTSRGGQLRRQRRGSISTQAAEDLWRTSMVSWLHQQRQDSATRMRTGQGSASITSGWVLLSSHGSLDLVIGSSPSARCNRQTASGWFLLAALGHLSPDIRPAAPSTAPKSLVASSVVSRCYR